MEIRHANIKKIRRLFVDGDVYSDAQISGIYELMLDLFDQETINKAKISNVYSCLNKLALRQALVLQCIYGIGKEKMSIVEITKQTRIRKSDVKKALESGKEKFYYFYQEIQKKQAQ